MVGRLLVNFSTALHGAIRNSSRVSQYPYFQANSTRISKQNHLIRVHCLQERKRRPVSTERELRSGACGFSFWKTCLHYFFGKTESFMPLPTRNFNVVLAGIWIVSPVAGFLPSRAFLSDLTSLPKPGRTNSPLLLTSLDARL